MNGGFNGATSSRTWKAAFGVTGLILSQPQLQWSHVLTNVERSDDWPGSRLQDRASMEPRPHERGKSSRTLLPRHRSRASMEPRPHERGKIDDMGIVLLTSPGASMEPRPHERGKPDLQGGKGGMFAASMEPRPHERGKPARHRRKRNDIRRASMEPRPHERGKVRGWRRMRRDGRNASMEPRPHERGKRRIAHLTTGRKQASMEPRPHERGKRCRAKSRSTSISSFNGATSSRTWKDSALRHPLHQTLASMEPRPHERGKC